MNYKEKFLEIFSFFIQGKSLEGTKEEDRNGRYVKKEKDGTKKIIWYKNGVIHNDNAPAIITKESSGKWTKEWYRNGELHRDGDEPAIIDSDDNKQWYKNGKLHREGDNPAIIFSNGDKFWYKDGYIHRNNAPAAIGMGKSLENWEQWYKNGKLHREDGPALKAPKIQGFYRDPGEQWWLDGKQVTKDEFDKFLSYKKLDKELPKNNSKPQNKKMKL